MAKLICSLLGSQGQPASVETAVLSAVCLVQAAQQASRHWSQRSIVVKIEGAKETDATAVVAAIGESLAGIDGIVAAPAFDGALDVSFGPSASGTKPASKRARMEDRTDVNIRISPLSSCSGGASSTRAGGSLVDYFAGGVRPRPVVVIRANWRFVAATGADPLFAPLFSSAPIEHPAELARLSISKWLVESAHTESSGDPFGVEGRAHCLPIADDVSAGDDTPGMLILIVAPKLPAGDAAEQLRAAYANVFLAWDSLVTASPLATVENGGGVTDGSSAALMSSAPPLPGKASGDVSTASFVEFPTGARGYESNNLTALAAYASRPSDYSSHVVLCFNSQWVAVRDKYRKALIHVLVIQRSGAVASAGAGVASSSSASVPPCTALTARSVLELPRTPAAARALASMRDFARQAWGEAARVLAVELARDGVTGDGAAGGGAGSLRTALADLGADAGSFDRALVGFHAVPSLVPLHLHVLSPDLHSECLKHKKHYLSFTSPRFFIPLVDALAAAQAGAAESSSSAAASADAERRRRAAEDALRGPLACHACGVAQPSLPALKGHLAACMPGGKWLRAIPPATAL